VLLVACSAREVTVHIDEGQFPPPLVSKLPITLGVFYDDKFVNHVLVDITESKTEPDWTVRTGQAQVQMWDILLGGMFKSLVHLHARPAPENDNPAVDAVLIPHVEELQYALPANTNIQVYEIWIRYRFELVTASGEEIAMWNMTAYGKTPTAFLQNSEKAVNYAAVMALRDAGANFVVSFAREPAVHEWLQQYER